MALPTTTTAAIRDFEDRRGDGFTPLDEPACRYGYSICGGHRAPQRGIGGHSVAAAPAAIERLDEMDGDADLEPGSWNERPDQSRWPRKGREELLCEDQEEDEPPEDNHDHEAIDEREPELWEGGGGDVPPWSVPQTSFNR